MKIFEGKTGILCEECEALLTDYLEGSLPEAQQEPIRRHLKTCDPCRRREADFSLTLKAFRQPLVPPPAVRMAIYEAAHEQAVERSSFLGRIRGALQEGLRFLLIPQARYALVALVVIGFVWLMSPLWYPQIPIKVQAPTGALSLPPPSVPGIKIEYARMGAGPLPKRHEAWMLDKTELRWLGELDGRQPSHTVTGADVDALIREARRLNVLPIPMLTEESAPCSDDQGYELLTLEFEGRRLKTKLCEGAAPHDTVYEFASLLKDWVRRHTQGDFTVE